MNINIEIVFTGKFSGNVTADSVVLRCDGEYRKFSLTCNNTIVSPVEYNSNHKRVRQTATISVDTDEDVAGMLRTWDYYRFVYQGTHYFDESTFNVESVTIIVDATLYKIPKERLLHVMKHKLLQRIMPDATLDLYNDIADVVSIQDSINTYKNELDLISDDTFFAYANIKQFLIDKVENGDLKDLCAFLELNSNEGSQIWNAVDASIEKYGGTGMYEIVSNRGTENEQVDTVTLLHNDAEDIKYGIEHNSRKDRIIYESEYNDKLNVLYIDSITKLYDFVDFCKIVKD